MKYKDLEAGKFLEAVGSDGYKWAEAFMELWGDKLSEIDHGLMISWFANAIENTRTIDKAAEQKAVEYNPEMVERILAAAKLPPSHSFKSAEEFVAYLDKLDSESQDEQKAVPGDEELVEEIADNLRKVDCGHYNRDCIELAKAALSTIRQHKPQPDMEGIREALEWQPIKTAPKDKLFIGIIEYAPGEFGRAFLAIWDHDQYVCQDQTDILPHIPTHWTPLPARPQALDQLKEGK